MKSKPMHKRHTFNDEPSYVITERGIRKSVYLCTKTISREQMCWVTEGREDSSKQKLKSPTVFTDSAKLTRQP